MSSRGLFRYPRSASEACLLTRRAAMVQSLIQARPQRRLAPVLRRRVARPLPESPGKAFFVAKADRQRDLFDRPAAPAQRMHGLRLPHLVFQPLQCVDLLLEL